MEADKDVLISNVFRKSVIWNRRSKGHANRSVVDKAWKEIATEMGVEDDIVLRKKWKYLRDQFAVEVGKLPPNHLSDSGSSTEPRWPYFKSLMFLVDDVKPRHLKHEKKQPTSLSILQDNESSEMVQKIETELTESVQSEEICTSETDPETELDDIFSVPQKRKRDSISAEYNKKRPRISNKNTSLTERIVQKCKSDDDDDALFFRSLLLFVKQIPHRLKLRFRSRVHELVEEFVYKGAQGSPYIFSPAFSPTTSNGGPSSDEN